MQDICARELKDHNILALERFRDTTKYMIEFLIKQPCCYGCPGDEVRLFLTEPEYRQALAQQSSQHIKIKRFARVVEGHIIYENSKKRHKR